MSVPSEKPNIHTNDCLALRRILNSGRHTEICGVDLKHAEGRIQDIVFERFLRKHSAIPEFQVSRAVASLQKTLEWRRTHEPRICLTEVETVLPELDLCHITLNKGRYVLWVRIDEMVLKGYSREHETLTPYKLQKLGLGVLEKLSSLMLQAAANSDDHHYSAYCVVEFSIHAAQSSQRAQRTVFRERLLTALENVATSFDDIVEEPEELSEYLGPDIPARYGGTGEPFTVSDLLRGDSLGKQSTSSASLERPVTNTPGDPGSEIADVNEAIPDSAPDADSKNAELDTEKPKLRLIYSEVIGPPPYVLDPDDLKTAENLCPDKMGARVYFADYSDTLVKFGHGVRLAEAEALHLASTQTTIATPKLVGAYILDDVGYILDDVGYILMSYERGTSLERYWDNASEAEQTRVLAQLKDYVSQMQNIQEYFIGGLDRSHCRDGIFEAGYDDYTKYSYGPYESEESFNEGIIQALRDRMRLKTLARENDMESNFFTSEYMLYQTVRGLKNHRIVFTHGDLHPGNMLVRADGTVVLVDWGLAGFWPEYWEFYRALFGIPWRVSWERRVEEFIPPHYVERSVLTRVFGTAWN